MKIYKGILKIPYRGLWLILVPIFCVGGYVCAALGIIPVWPIVFIILMVASSFFVDTIRHYTVCSKCEMIIKMKPSWKNLYQKNIQMCPACEEQTKLAAVAENKKEI